MTPFCLKDAPSPCYILEEEKLRRNLRLIQSVAQRSGAEIILAFKAFALWRTFPIFREYIAHTTASSPFEARLAYEEFGSKAHTYSPAYEEETFGDILACSSHVTFNSLSQYRRFYPAVKQWNRDHDAVSCGLRINPEYSEISTELYNPCAPGSRFGILASQLPDTLPEGVEGFHCHNHCESSAEALAHTLEHIEAKFGRWLDQVKWLNLGGGHLMTREGYDVERLVSLLTDVRRRHPNLSVVLEPGSAFAWQTGPLVSRVVDVVENDGIKTAVLGPVKYHEWFNVVRDEGEKVTYSYSGTPKNMDCWSAETDARLVREGYATISSVKYDQSDAEGNAVIEKWELEL